MQASALLNSVLGAALVATAWQAAAQSSPQQPSTAQAPPAMPRGPIRTPLGTRQQELLLAKITVSDLHRSHDFYTRIIGLKRALSRNQTETPLPAPGTEPPFIEIAYNFSGSMADPFFDIVKQRGMAPVRELARLTWIGFKVPDAAAVTRRARAAGFQVVRDAPVVGPGEMSIGIILDPDGYTVEVIKAADYPK